MRWLILLLPLAVLLSGCSVFNYKDQLKVHSDQYEQYTRVKERELELRAEIASQPIVDVQGQITSIKVWMPGAGSSGSVEIEQPKLHERYWAEVIRDVIPAAASIGKWYFGTRIFGDVVDSVFKHAGSNYHDSFNTNVNDSYNRAWERTIKDSLNDQSDHSTTDSFDDESENWVDSHDDNSDHSDNSDNRQNYSNDLAPEEE